VGDVVVVFISALIFSCYYSRTCLKTRPTRRSPINVEWTYWRGHSDSHSCTVLWALIKEVPDITFIDTYVVWMISLFVPLNKRRSSSSQNH